MFRKVLKFWRALSPASMPRALWLLVHHLALPAVEEETWAALLDLIRELLLFQPRAAVEMHTQARPFPACWPPFPLPQPSRLFYAAVMRA